MLLLLLLYVYQIAQDTKHKRQSKSLELRQALSTCSATVEGRPMFVIRMPLPQDHIGHEVGKVSITVVTVSRKTRWFNAYFAQVCLMHNSYTITAGL
jgi:hypothetical protein